jgi:hypothetical protein
MIDKSSDELFRLTDVLFHDERPGVAGAVRTFLSAADEYASSLLALAKLLGDMR